MVEATNFIEKTLGKNIQGENSPETLPEVDESVAIYTPPPAPKQEANTPPPQIIQQPIQIIEKIVYKKQRIHGFFRTLTIIALLTIGFLMLGESTGLIELSVNSFKLHQIFPIFIIFSTIIIRSYRGRLGKIFGLILFLTVFGWIFTIGIYTSLNPSSKRKAENIINNTAFQIDENKDNNIYLETLLGNSYIEGSNKNTNIQSTRNSDRNLLVTSGTNTKINYLKFIEDNNRNVLQNYVSNIDIALPKDTSLNLLYIKNLLWLHTVDLTNFQWHMLKFQAGIDDITIRIGNVLSGNKIEIQWTAANVTLDIPNDVGVMMYYKHFIGKINFPQFNELTGHYYQSTNMQTAKTILNVYVNLWIGNTKINRVNAK